jgi:hypothetical protein
MAIIVGVSVGSDGAVWCVDSAGNAYMRVGSEWKKNPTAKADEVAVGNVSNVWCRNSAGEVFKLQGSDFSATWAKDAQASQVTSISAGADGTVWVTNSKGQMAYLQGGQWHHVPDVNTAVEVAVGSAAHIWYRDNKGLIYKKDGSGKWQKDNTASDVISLSAGNDGTVWVANSKHELWTMSGGVWKKNDKGTARQISVGKQGLAWVVNAAGEIYHVQAADWPTYWVKVALPKDMPASTKYTIKQGDTVTGIIRAKYPTISTAELRQKSDTVARLNGWPGTMDDNYGGRAKSLKPGDVIVLEA